MESRWFNSVVVLFWLATMSWLVVAKVLPPLRRGDPPNYRSMYTESREDQPPVGWDLVFNGKPLGWAISRIQRNTTGMTEVRSRIHFDRIPLTELSPHWMRLLMRMQANPLERLEMDVLSKLEIDPLGHLSRFESSMRLGGSNEAIKITGVVGSSRVKIKVEAGGVVYTPDAVYLPSDALISDELSPQPRMVGLRPGQEWTAPSFSPLRPPHNPIEILQARVEGREPMVWNGEAIGVHQVVYRPDAGSALASSSEPRGRLWVRDDGTVLKQEVTVLGSRLVFTRMGEERSSELDERWQQDEAGDFSAPRSRELDGVPELLPLDAVDVGTP